MPVRQVHVARDYRGPRESTFFTGFEAEVHSQRLSWGSYLAQMTFLSCQCISRCSFGKAAVQPILHVGYTGHRGTHARPAARAMQLACHTVQSVQQSGSEDFWHHPVLRTSVAFVPAPIAYRTGPPAAYHHGHLLACAVHMVTCHVDPTVYPFAWYLASIVTSVPTGGHSMPRATAFHMELQGRRQRGELYDYGGRVAGYNTSGYNYKL